MPLLWKKVKSTGISQFVNDHLHNSQRRRGDSSLLVETGFPTSLVDLFIKNREKLKKSPKKKRGKKSPSIQFDDLAISRSSPSSMPSLSLDPSHTASPSLDPIPLASPIHSPPVLALTPESKGANGGEDVGSGLKMGVDTNGIFLAVVKMFLVVVLAFGSKKFALGFTLSAFLLFFVDYVLKHMIRNLEPSLEAQNGLKLRMQRVLRIFSFERDRSVRKKAVFPKSEIQQVECFSPAYSDSKDRDSNFRIQETQSVEPDCNFPRVEEIQCEEIIDESGCDGSDGYPGYEERDLKMVVMEKQEPTSKLSVLERKKSRKVEIKSRMKKLIPKKFRSSRRKQHSESGEISPIMEDKEHPEISEISSIKEDSIAIVEEQKAHEYEDVRELESHSNVSSSSSGRYDREDLVVADNCRSELGNKEAAPATQNGEQERAKEGQIWIYFLLCSIVLIGLIGGRIFALFLTLFWCLAKHYKDKVPRIWPFAKISS